MRIDEVSIKPNSYGEGETYIILLNGKEEYHVRGGEPEDNSLGRDLSFAYSIVDSMKTAWEAGSKGDKIESYQHEFDDDDLYYDAEEAGTFKPKEKEQA